VAGDALRYKVVRPGEHRDDGDAGAHDGGLAEVLAPGVVMAVAGIAPLAATLALWRTLADF
jgi:hypothetical protein